jgi:hypothetical protein
MKINYNLRDRRFFTDDFAAVDCGILTACARRLKVWFGNLSHFIVFATTSMNWSISYVQAGNVYDS